MTAPLKYVRQHERPPAANEIGPSSAKGEPIGNEKADAPIVAGAAKSGKPPTELQALSAWLVWRRETVDGEVRKVPYYAHGGKRLGRQGDASDVRQLVTFDAALRAAHGKGFTGVGFATLPQFEVSALDFDHVVRDGVVDPGVLNMLAGTYAEFSPSGTGVHAFVAGSFGANRKSHANATTPFGFEVFSTKGFVTFTGEALPCSVDAIGERTAALTALYAKRFGDGTASATSEPIGMSVEQIKTCMAALDPDITYNEWLQAGMAAHFETQGAIEALDAWDDWSSNGSKYPGRDSLESRWEGFGRSDGAQVTGGTLLKMARAAGLEVGQVAAPSDFEVIPEPALPPGGHFRITNADDFVAAYRPSEWFIKGFLPKASLAVIYGESSSGKTFLTLDVVYAIARGTPWNGCHTRQGRILYIVAEGVGGFRNRLRAYKHQHAVGRVPLEVITDVPPNLRDPADVRGLIEDVKALGPFDLIVMDTLARVTPGANENSGEDMGLALSNADRIGRAADAMVLLVHHSGKDASKGMRGWSGIYAAADVVLEVTRFENDRAVQVTKQKDGRDGDSFGFRLLDVVLEQDDQGEDVTSCVVEYTGAAKAKRSSKPGQKPAQYDRVASVLADMVGLSVDGTVSQGELIRACKAQIPRDPSKKGDNRTRAVERAMEQLQADGYLRVDDDVVGLVGVS